MVRLENVNNAIKNLGKDAETVTAEGCAEILAKMLGTGVSDFLCKWNL